MSTDAAHRAETLQALLRELRDVSTQAVLFSEAVAERLGINPTDVECLGILAEAGSLTAGRLAALTGLTTGAITGVVDRLARAGYVRREQDARDRRRVIVHPIVDRVQAIAPLFDSIAQASLALCAGYDDAELALILEFLARGNTMARAETEKLLAASRARRRWHLGAAGR